MSKVHLFAYGTLKRGCRMNHLLDGQEFLGPGNTQPRYRLYNCGAFPCLVWVATGGVAVQGEVWAVEEDALRRIDEWEDAPNLFVRQSIELENVDRTAEAYFYRGDVFTLKDCGPVWPASPEA